MSCRCGCCVGIERVTPVAVANRPGLDALRRRVGTHALFLESMLARLSTMEVRAELPDPRAGELLRPLRSLTARTTDDPAIALLDAWALVADVLAFYHERIANEGYLRTATERRSVLELARLIGYRLRPGVAASVYLAFTVEKDAKLIVPPGTRAQSVPAPGETMESFETDEPLDARAAWNLLCPRRTAPDFLQEKLLPDELYLRGDSTGLTKNGLVMIDFGTRQALFEVRGLEVEPEATCTGVGMPVMRTHVTLGPFPQQLSSKAIRAARRALIAAKAGGTDLTDLDVLLSNPAILRTPGPTPNTSARLSRNPQALFGPGSAGVPALLAALDERIGDRLYHAWRAASAPAGVVPQEMLAFRAKAAPFGHNAPFPSRFNRATGENQPSDFDWMLAEPGIEAEKEDVELETLALDGIYDQVGVGSWVVILRVEEKPMLLLVNAVGTVSRAAYGMSARVTQLTFDRPWLKLSSKDRTNELHRLTPLRAVTVYLQSESLPLAERPLGDELRGDTIELSGLYDGLKSGRWIIVTGERADVPGVEGRELAMIAGVSHAPRTVRPDGAGADITLPGDRVHTTLTLTDSLAYVYRLETVKIWGNVAKATHGETRAQVLGGGDAAVVHQTFALKSQPLTYVSAATPAGTATTLEVRVNDVRWREVESISVLGPEDRGFISDTDDEGTTSTIFGDGGHGARLPTGAENVRAVHRSGIGKPGNVRQDQISLLASRPLGLKDVINPLRATGGSDPDTRDQARKNAPLVTRALGRIVSIEDYADFARTFAGIGKASAVPVTDGRRRQVHLTVAGVDDAALDDTSDVMVNLRRALRDFGDPSQRYVVAIRELVVLVIAARLRIDPDYLWDKVEAAVRVAMLEAFGAARRELGQDVTSSEVIATLARVGGVTAVDLDVLAGFSDAEVRANLDTLGGQLGVAARVRAELAQVRGDPPTGTAILAPAQLVILTPAIPDTLVLTEWPR